MSHQKLRDPYDRDGPDGKNLRDECRAAFFICPDACCPPLISPELFETMQYAGGRWAAYQCGSGELRFVPFGPSYEREYPIPYVPLETSTEDTQYELVGEVDFFDRTGNTVMPYEGPVDSGNVPSEAPAAKVLRLLDDAVRYYLRGDRARASRCAARLAISGFQGFAGAVQRIRERAEQVRLRTEASADVPTRRFTIDGTSV